MKKFYLIASGLILLGLSLNAQFLTPRGDYKVVDFMPDYTVTGAFDLNDTCMVILNADSVVVVDTRDSVILGKYFEPADYTTDHFISFVEIAPDGRNLWAGYTTLDFSDDRIYRIDMRDGSWTLEATFPGNYDLEFWNDSILVSGTNSATFGDPSDIWLLDRSGDNQHRRLAAVGGYSAGIAIDAMGDLYYGTSYPMDPNLLLQWDSVALEAVISDAGASALQLEDALKLSDLPAGATDCAVDAGGSLFVNVNLYGGTKVLTRWNGTAGDGMQLDTLATTDGAYDWLSSIGTTGVFEEGKPGNSVFTYSFGTALTGVHKDFLPEVAMPLADIELTDPTGDSVIALTGVFSDPDDPDEEIDIRLASNSDPSIVTATLANDTLRLSFATERSGEAEIVIEAQSNGKVVRDTMTVTLISTVGTGLNRAAQVEVYPNPAGEMLWVQIDGQHATLEVYNLQGSCLHRDILVSETTSVHLSGLKAGSYVIMVNVAGRTHRQLIQKL